MKKTLFISFITLLLVGGILTSIGYYYIFAPITNINKTTYLYIDNSDTFDSILQKIKKEGVVERLQGFQWLADYNDYGKHIRTGRYAIQPGDDAITLYRRLSRGQQTPVKIVVPSVRTLDKLAQHIGKQLMIDSIDIATPLNDSLFCAQMGYDRQTVSCLFIPNTYEVYWNISAEGFFKRIKKENEHFWNEKRLAQAKQIGFTPTEITTIASIVEEETAHNPEKSTVAGLYINRLHRGMLLQADPTVKYALQDFTLRRILLRHLEVDSPYNTYKYAGLPPGPIRIPTIKGLESVLNYQKHNYLYMCAKEDFSGSHNFATTLSQHNANAQRYQRELNRRGIQ